MERVRILEPWPQVLLQADQAVQAPWTQSTGQELRLQFWEEVRTGHSLPPLATAVVTLRVRVWEPPPQVLVQ
jgi:hypothetical protein